MSISAQLRRLQHRSIRSNDSPLTNCSLANAGCGIDEERLAGVQRLAREYHRLLIEYDGPIESLYFSSCVWEACSNKLSRKDLVAELVGVSLRLGLLASQFIPIVLRFLQEADADRIAACARSQLQICAAYHFYSTSALWLVKETPQIVFGTGNSKMGLPYKQTLCRHFEKGNCSRGITCTFLHGVDDPVLQVRALKHEIDNECEYWKRIVKQSLAKTRTEDQAAVGRLRSLMLAQAFSQAVPKTDAEKILLSVKKKLREIDQLEDAAAEGQILSANQIVKISKKAPLDQVARDLEAHLADSVGGERLSRFPLHVLLQHTPHVLDAVVQSLPLCDKAALGVTGSQFVVVFRLLDPQERRSALVILRAREMLMQFC